MFDNFEVWVHIQCSLQKTFRLFGKNFFSYRLNIAKMSLFNPCIKFDFFLFQITYFESLSDFIKNMYPAPSKCLNKWIKVDKLDYFEWELCLILSIKPKCNNWVFFWFPSLILASLICQRRCVYRISSYTIHPWIVFSPE